MPFIQLDIETFVEKHDLSVEGHSIQDMRAEILYHREQQEMLRTTVPSSVRFANLVEVRPRASHRRRTRFIPDSLRQSAPLFLTRRYDRTPRSTARPSATTSRRSTVRS